MEKRFIYLLLGFGLLLGINACQKDQTIGGEIDEVLLPYFEKFKKEAESRGVAIDYESLGISGTLTRINDPSIAGQCIHNEDEPNKIAISRSYWNSIDTVKREFLIFHELGHCILSRAHLDSKDASGNCVSIMHSSEGICKFNYTGNSRIQYINELFNP